MALDKTVRPSKASSGAPHEPSPEVAGPGLPASTRGATCAEAAKCPLLPSVPSVAKAAPAPTLSTSTAAGGRAALPDAPSPVDPAHQGGNDPIPFECDHDFGRVPTVTADVTAPSSDGAPSSVDEMSDSAAPTVQPPPIREAGNVNGACGTIAGTYPKEIAPSVSANGLVEESRAASDRSSLIGANGTSDSCSSRLPLSMESGPVVKQKPKATLFVPNVPKPAASTSVERSANLRDLRAAPNDPVAVRPAFTATEARREPRAGANGAAQPVDGGSDSGNGGSDSGNGSSPPLGAKVNLDDAAALTDLESVFIRQAAAFDLATAHISLPTPPAIYSAPQQNLLIGAGYIPVVVQPQDANLEPAPGPAAPSRKTPPTSVASKRKPRTLDDILPEAPAAPATPRSAQTSKSDGTTPRTTNADVTVPDSSEPRKPLTLSIKDTATVSVHRAVSSARTSDLEPAQAPDAPRTAPQKARSKPIPPPRPAPYRPTSSSQPKAPRLRADQLAQQARVDDDDESEIINTIARNRNLTKVDGEQAAKKAAELALADAPVDAAATDQTDASSPSADHARNASLTDFTFLADYDSGVTTNVEKDLDMHAQAAADLRDHDWSGPTSEPRRRSPSSEGGGGDAKRIRTVPVVQSDAIKSNEWVTSDDENQSDWTAEGLAPVDSNTVVRKLQPFPVSSRLDARSRSASLSA